MSALLHELPVLQGHAPARERAEEGLQGFGLRYDAAQSEAGVLSDGFGRQHTYLRVSLVERCNLRCPYCMPEDGLDWTPDAQLLTDDEIVRLVRLFVEAGITKLRLTGGEPLLRSGVEALATRLGALPGLRALAMTTNGLLLPKKLARLQEAGVSLLNISLDTLRSERFEAMTRRRGHALVLRAIDAALAAGYAPLKVNCVVLRGTNDDELADFVAWTQNTPVEVRFIEFMPFDGNGWDDRRLVPFSEMLARIRARFPALERLKSGPHDTSKTFQVPGFRGRVGFITSMTDPFCEGCNRLRLTADGHLKVCLFGRAEVSLRDAMRAGATDAELRQIVSQAVGQKKARHAGMYDLAEMNSRPMTTIGG